MAKRKRKHPKEEQLNLFIFIDDTMILEEQIDLFEKIPQVGPPDGQLFKPEIKQGDVKNG